MTEAPQPAAPTLAHVLASLEALRTSGAQARDPVRFCHLETLALRLPAQAPAVQTHLTAALHRGLADFERRHATTPTTPTPAATAPAQPALRRSGLGHLKALNRDLRHPQTDSAPGGNAPSAPGAVPEMKSVQQFRRAWGRMKVQDQVERALTQGPANAGPLNSHRLVLRTLALMQDLSPAYLHHFMGHLDTLLQLESLTLPQPAKPVKAGKAPGRKPAPKKQT
ncbi:DUF2894 domain-containing protein [Rhodoferax sp.]|uniref:DUF2894 domain-containing protein n=1 Tax=Rhodoferax sp. TaxID=50421 RepID=UPI0025DB1B71|nr:DUF2894 domain-containing protein [Rhodoferax sp.]